MKISDGEKLILIMLSELYDTIGVEGEIDPEFIRSSIYTENTWGIPWKYPGIPFETQETPEIVSEVLDILEMWNDIEYSFDKLSDEQKELIEKEAKPFGKDPKFKGFDGNNESEYMGVASFLINSLDRFEEFKGRYLNSHAPKLSAYHRMLSVYKTFQGEYCFNPLTPEQLVTLLKEQMHPDNRNKF